MNEELMGVFLDEVGELLRQLEKDILRLECEGPAEATIQSIFRAAHTLKGSAAVMGFEQMKALTHEMEDVFDKIRHHELSVTPETVNVLFECLDMLAALKREIEEAGATSSDTEGVVVKLRALVQDSPSADGQDGGTRLRGPESRTGASGALPENGTRRVECRVAFAGNCEMKAARAYVIHRTLSEHGRMISTFPGMEEVIRQGDVDEMSYFLDTGFALDELEALILRDSDVKSAVIVEADNRPHEGKMPEDSAAETTPAAEAAEVPVHHAEGEAERHVRSGQTVRVDVERLDHLMNLVGELVIDQTRIAQLGNRIRDDDRAEDALEDLDQVASHISRVVSELQESVMKARMLPIDRLFSRFPRMVRDLARELGKDVELVVTGEETELDRTVIEEIGDPIIHLLRNAVDHGIEFREERLAAGKAQRGTIRLSAMNQESHVVITVEDDGRGIFPDKIRSSAVGKGIVSPQAAEAMSDREAIQLIFAPGFSTAETVNDVSGRGVGMDIVRTHIEKLNGMIDIDTKPGEGTAFVIKLPLTLAIVRGLLIRLNHLTFALPLGSVVEIVRIPREEITSVKGRPIVQIREQMLPIAWLHDHFKIPRMDRAGNHVFVVVVGLAEKRIGLVVDELVGNQEIVVKSIGSYAGKTEGISGATILGDGSVALILDVAGVLKLVSGQEGIAAEDRTPAAGNG